MRYPYECVVCKTDVIIDKPMMESDRVEYCSKCENVLKRIYGVGGIKTADGMKTSKR